MDEQVLVSNFCGFCAAWVNHHNLAAAFLNGLQSLLMSGAVMMLPLEAIGLPPCKNKNLWSISGMEKALDARTFSNWSTYEELIIGRCGETPFSEGSE